MFNLFNSKGNNKYFFKMAKILLDLSNSPTKLLNHSKRVDLEKLDFHTIISFLLGMFSISTSYFESVISLCKNGYGQNSMAIIRTQLESLLIFLYFIEPENNLIEIEQRINKYADWISIKQFNNSNKSSNFFLLKAISGYQDYIDEINENYRLVCEKYKNNKIEFNRLSSASSFLINKASIADKFEIRDLYNHIQAECSSTIHVGDVFDRIIYEETEDLIGYSFNSYISDTTWPLSLSNFVQFHLLVNFGNFFEINNYIKPYLEKLVTKNNQKFQNNIQPNN